MTKTPNKKTTKHNKKMEYCRKKNGNEDGIKVALKVILYGIS